MDAAIDMLQMTSLIYNTVFQKEGLDRFVLRYYFDTKRFGT